MPERTDHNEAMRLADLFELEPDPESLYRKAASLLRQQAERIAELEAMQAGIMQAITDPENQPSQYGTVTLDYLYDKLKEWERRWAKRDEQADKAEAERDQLRAEVERLRVDAEQWQAHKEVLKASHLDESLTIRMTMRHKGLNVEREGVLTMLAAEHAITGGDEIAAHMAGRYFNEMKSAIDAARTTHKETE